VLFVNVPAITHTTNTPSFAGLRLPHYGTLFSRMALSHRAFLKPVAFGTLISMHVRQTFNFTWDWVHESQPALQSSKILV
jgi:hypothetical protein